ncbi:MAG: hypothetical protein C5B49_06920, partial [Bdellovibrio sp.]
ESYSRGGSAAQAVGAESPKGVTKSHAKKSPQANRETSETTPPSQGEAKNGIKESKDDDGLSLVPSVDAEAENNAGDKN